MAAFLFAASWVFLWLIPTMEESNHRRSIAICGADLARLCHVEIHSREQLWQMELSREGSSELDYLHSPRLAPGKCEVVVASPAPMCDKEEEKYSRDKKKAAVCVTDRRISRMELETEEKRAHAFAVGRASALAVDVPLGHLPFQEDEMLSWLQYPLDDAFSKSYCSEQLCEQPLTLYPAQSSILGSISLNSEKLSSTSFSSQLVEPSDSSVGIESFTSDAAMAMGAHRAAGLLPQAGAEAFNIVHTTRQLSDNASSSKASDTRNVEDNHAGKQSARNFSFFSQRVAAMKTSLQILGTSSGPSNKERLKQPFSTRAHKKSSSLEQSAGTSASLTSLSPRGESCLSDQGRETMQASDSHAGQKFTDPSHHLDEVGKAKTGINARSAAVGFEAMETGDVTAVTSLSDGSDYSSEKSGKEVVDLSCKRKPCPAEDFECDSKDARKVASQEKDRPTLDRLNSSKRTRAAEIHNQSERRRRNKINEKMRALQELIPNANKTDKASMLDEAIEYLKMLQAQLQWMSMRTGMMVPPVMMPPGMEYLAVPQRQGPSQVNMGMGVSRGVAMDASNSGTGGLSWRPPFPGQPLPGHAFHLTGYPPNGSPSVLHEVPSSMNPNHWHPTSAFQQLQPLPSPGTASIYKAHMQARSADSRKQP